jgi:hypothetical protein
MTRTYSDVWAVPGQNHILDVINPETGLTAINGDDSAAVTAREPNAVRMSWSDWQAAAIERQREPAEWKATTRERYHEMLEILPPALWIGGGFLVGEPMDHDFATGAPRFSAYLERHGSYLTSSRPLTATEFRKEVQS